LDDQTPCHRLYLDGYYIDKYDVSVIEYEKCVSMKKCGVPKSRFHERFCNWGHSDRGNHPVNCVDWNQASAYCKWAEKRLPTEAEWEKAARGVDGRKYPWGNEFDCKKSCNMVAPCHIESTCPVGSYLEGISPYGVLDMSGNVLQWVADWYDAKYYCNSLYQNPMGPPSGSDRVMRGGSFSSIDPYLLSDYHRSQLSPADSDPNFGFRCARDAD
jgi:iron(II)-dependent oxidoreductase